MDTNSAPTARLHLLGLALLSVACTPTDNGIGNAFMDDEVGESETSSSEGMTEDATDDATDPDDATDATDATETSTDDGTIFDLGSDETGIPGEVCDAVDILFVIDSSGSMGDEQVALGQAFPQFIDAIVGTLPGGVNVHIGVTTTEMSPGGLYAVAFPCNGQKPDWYLTPDTDPSGVNGAQGRLYQVPNYPSYYEFETDAPAPELQAVSDWFVQAAAVGIEGSSEEMSLAGAGWAFDPVNDATNAGFVRDAGAALVVFFVTDEDDQTPIDGGVGQELIDRIAAAKTDCGGLDCVAAGGTVRESCLPQDGLGLFFGQLQPDRVYTTGLEYNTETTSDFFVDALQNNLAQIIGDLCDDIQPEG